MSLTRSTSLEAVAVPSRLAEPAPRAGRAVPRSGVAPTPALTVADVRRVLATAHRRLAPRGATVAIAFESVALLPPRPGRTGLDVPTGRRGLMVYPARVRCTVHCARGTELIDATYRFWDDGTGGWGFTGPLSPALADTTRDIR